MKKIKSALISVFNKEEIEPLVRYLGDHNVTLYSTGGTFKFLQELGLDVTEIETVTGYPSILGGRVKTLHPKVFGGILSRRGLSEDISQVEEYEIPEIDLVLVDLYPFEETVGSGANEQEVIEKIDIGGISLIRAAAKNFNDVVVISSREQYSSLLKVLKDKGCATNLSDRKIFATQAFDVSSHYDSMIFKYFNADHAVSSLKISSRNSKKLRYGENPHQRGFFYGQLDELLDQLNGKELSYNNLVDIDAAVQLISEFHDPSFAIIKHTNACGVASDDNLLIAYKKALEADPVSAFGGILITNKIIDHTTATEINSLFFEVLIAPDFDQEALELLKEKKNRILVRLKNELQVEQQVKSLLNGFAVQDLDTAADLRTDFKTMTEREPSPEETDALEFASKVCKHTKSNAIVLASQNQLLASGTGQTSRVDALNQAIKKANKFGFDLNGAVMASDAFFPFPDCVKIAHIAGITAVIQPGGSKKDQDSIDYCNQHQMAMVFTGKRHFKH